MTLYNVEGTVDALYQGISQQPVIERSPNQCMEQVNMYSSLLDGVRTRPGSFYKKDLGLLSSDTFRDRMYFKDSDNQEYSLVLYERAGVINAEVFNESGTAQTVTGLSTVASYLGDGTTLKTLQVSEDEFLFLNTDVKPIMNTTTSQTFEYYRGQRINVAFEPCSGTDSTFILTTAGSSYSSTLTEEDLVSGSTIATKIRTDLTAAGLPSVWVGGNCIGFVSLQAEDVSIDVYGALSDCYTRLDYLTPCTNEAYLPDYANTFQIQPMIVGGFEYYMQFQYTETPTTTSTLYKGYWAECVPQYEEYLVQDSTWPILLTHQDDGTFNFSTPAWTDKSVGGDSANPSFLGKTINDMALKQDRLIFAHNTGITCSRSSEHYDFFPITTKTAREDTVIDIMTSNPDSSVFAIVEVSTHLLIVGTKEQYLLSGNEAIGLSSRLAVSTEIPITSKIRPVVAGNRVFILSDVQHAFFTGMDQYSKVIELTVYKDRATPSLVEYTQHVPKYVPSDVRAFAVDTMTGLLAILPNTTDGKVYICQYKHNATELLQQAWSEWEFDGVLHNIIIREGCLEVTEQLGDYTIVSIVPLAESITEPSVIVALDNKVFVTVQADGTWALPTILSGDTVAVHTSDEKLYKTSDTETPVQGDTLVVGKVIPWKYVPSIPYPAISDKSVRGLVFIIDRFKFWLRDSGPISINDVTYGLDVVSGDREYFQSRSCETREGDYRENIEIVMENTTGSYLPVKIASYDWFGRLKQKGRRM